MELPHRAFLRITRVAAPYPGGVGGHGAQPPGDLLGLGAQLDGVAVGLGHLLSIQAGHARRPCEQRVGLGEDDLARAFQEPVQALLVAQRDVLLRLEQRAGHFERILVTLLLVPATLLAVQPGALPAHLGDRGLGLGGKIRLASVHVVETPGDLARQLDVRNLVFAHRHVSGLVDEDVGALQQRVAQEPVGGEVELLEPFLLILVARHAFQPAQRRDHGQQQVKLGVLGHTRLDEQAGRAGIDPCRQPVDDHVPGGLLDDPRVIEETTWDMVIDGSS